MQQGALSRLILLNYYMNHLITQLNTVNMRTHIGNIQVSNLPFADDMVLMAKSKDKLQQLLHVCFDWANAWNVKFSFSKFKPLTNQRPQMERLKLKGENMLGTEIKYANASAWFATQE